MSGALERMARLWRSDLWPVLWVPPVALLALAADAEPPASALGWLALAPLAAGLRWGRGSAAAWAAAGWGWGLVYAGGQLAWLHHALVVQAGMGALHFVNFFALVVGTLALASAAGTGLARWAWLRWGLSPLAVWPVLLAGQDALLGVFPFGGLAWGSLAGPQAHTWAARAAVPLLGGSGLVLGLGLVNAGWAALAIAAWQRRGAGGPSRPAPWKLPAAIGAWAALTAFCAWTAPPLAVPPDAPRIEALLVPGDLSLQRLEAERGTSAPLRHYLGRTLAAAVPPAEPTATAGAPPRLVVWPESAVPGPVERGKSLVELSEVGGLLRADILLGSNALRRGREYNALYLVDGGRFDFRRYDKRRLVPFGEYVPAGFHWLFPRKVTAGEADYAAGTGPPVLDWRGGRLGAAICFESILPGHVGAAVDAGARLLVAVANDAWLTPAARARHLRLTALRGLEVGRDVLFVANRGWNAHLRGGQALVRLHWSEPPRGVQAALRGERTLFANWGLAAPALPAGLLGLAAAFLRRGRGGRPAP